MASATPAEGSRPDSNSATRASLARRNLYVSLVVQFLMVASFTITLGPVFDKYIFQLGGSNVFVGLVESLNGLVYLAVIAPVAWLVDKRGPGRRTELIRIAAAVGVFGSSLFLYSITLDHLPYLYAALASNGLYFELFSSSMGALVTDSASVLGEVQKWTVAQSVAQGIAACAGPLLTLGVQIWTGADPAPANSSGAEHTGVSNSDPNQWSLPFIHMLLLLGVIPFIPMLFGTMVAFKDIDPPSKKVDNEASASGALVEPLIAATPNPESGRGAPPVAASSSMPPPPGRSSLVRTKSAGSDGDRNAANSAQQFSIVRTSSISGPYDQYIPYIPYIIACADVITCLGVGMSSKFIMLFLIEDYELTGIEVTLFQLAAAVSIVIYTVGLQALNDRGVGTRCQLSLVCTLISISSYFALAHVPPPDPHLDSVEKRNSTSLYLICFFGLTAGLAYAKGALDKSLVLETTSQTERGFWNAIESFNGTLYGGMSFVGGYLADSYGYRSIFSFTSYVWLFAALIYAPLLWIVQEDNRGKANESENKG